MAWFDTEEVEGGEFLIIPVGRYNFMIESCEKKTSKTDKEMIALKFKIIDEKFKNRLIFDNLVIGDQTYGEIARRKFKAIVLACGLTKIDYPSDLNEKILSAQVEHYKDKLTGSTREKILNYQVFDYVEPLQEQVVISKNLNVNSTKTTQHVTKEPTKVSALDDDLPF